MYIYVKITDFTPILFTIAVKLSDGNRNPFSVIPGGILNNGVSYKWSNTLHLREGTHLIFYFYRSLGYNVRRTHNTKCHSHVKCIMTRNFLENSPCLLLGTVYATLNYYLGIIQTFVILCYLFYNLSYYINNLVPCVFRYSSHTSYR